MNMQRNYSFTDVAKEVYQLENQDSLNGYSEDIQKKYKGYFDQICTLLYIEKEVGKIKQKNRYSFSENGKNLLVKLLYHYEMNNRANEKYVTKNLKKQIIENNQYNAFFAYNITACYDDIVAANNLIVLAFDCFYQIFLDAGKSEVEIEKILSSANRKYTYKKRKYFGEILNLFKNYIHELDVISKERRKILGLTEKEEAIWLEYANTQIKNTMKEVLSVRDIMQKKAMTIHDEEISVLEFTKNQELYENDRIMEQDLLNKCSVDEKILKCLEAYKRITGNALNLERLVSVVILNGNSESAIKEILAYELLGVPVDGNIKITTGETKELKKILEDMYSIVNNLKDEYRFNLFYKENRKRIKDEELLDYAIHTVKE